MDKRKMERFKEPPYHAGEILKKAKKLKEDSIPSAQMAFRIWLMRPAIHITWISS